MPSDSNTDYAPHIPDAVRRASARADELARAAGVANVPDLPGESGDNSADIGSSQISTTEVNAPDTAPVAPDPSANQAGDNSQQGRLAPASTPFVDWEQRYATLQGKYNSEIPELRGQIKSLENLIAAMNTAPRSEPASAPLSMSPGGPTPASHIPEADIEAWGQDLVEATGRWTDARVAPRLEDFERRLLSIEGGARQLSVDSAKRSAEAALERAVPNWEQINQNTNFHLWLSQVDPFSGRSRQQMLTEAHNAGDAARVIAFFRGFLAEQTAVTQPASGIPLAQTAPPADRLPLESLAVPGRGSVTLPAQGAPESKIWTTAEIAHFFRQKTRGVWNGREADAARIEQDIVAAGREGRVR